MFDNIPQPNPLTCSTLISALITHGLPNEAIKIYSSLRACEIKPDRPVFLAAAKVCAVSGVALRVKEVHDDATWCGVMSDVFVGNVFMGNVYVLRV